MDTFDDSLAFVKFGVGQPVTRKEDPTSCAVRAATPTTSICRARPMR